MEEHRQFKRYEVKEVTGSLLYTMDIKVIDMSLQGMKIESSRRLDVGRKYSIRIGKKGEMIGLSGLVVWCTLSRTTNSTEGEFVPVYQAGIEYEGILSGKAGELLEFLKHNAVIKLEDRIFGRFKCNLDGPVNLDSQYEFLVKQISLSGMLIESELLPDVESFFDMELKAAGDAIPIKGRVVHAQRIKENKEANLAHIGVEFIDLSSDALNVLDGFIKNELNK